MDALEEQREAAEGRFREMLVELTEQIVQVREATDRTTALYRAQVEARREALASVRDRRDKAAGEESLDRDGGWPRGGGLRGLVNRLARWLMRDFLEAIDRRQHLHTRRVEDLELRVDRLQGTLAGDGDVGEALNEALGRAHGALQAALSTYSQMLDLVNAKDAEVLQRAVAGPLRRMELLFDEFGRQQEALLSQLVGKRRELEELTRGASPDERM